MSVVHEFPRHPGVVAECELGLLFLQCGRIREPDPVRLGAHHDYKKGWEVRLSLPAGDINRVRGLLGLAGLQPGSAYRKGRKFILPIYGRDAAELFRFWADEMRTSSQVGGSRAAG